ncbi:Phosphomannomutase (ManB) (PDB:6MNV) [Commensalibacter communis]|uniref:Phosphomannomutase (ManB) n=1 Tax=Commensalibacter communis TaxID=2972786 RepID=A0A9W4TRF3_9PROT|nr:phosphomannomutase/phosphoglucomutase [Commensalibacter communis]CAI3954593.1 Phosphomannomutase (ManB) (PDB:6MNV) [Commensalibacter communis]CAI3955554.1 Phosphomannomutase (ManB) (PDB:6MNV) [Commensalibacter communis]CAI3955909.1 Phosphomannomutase (ManB) (PDB:6MNV) [Commensalibacter communis]CAI3956426.1 Phosphomannomutase (ManB) (PDB:6MNV) [Commensalibacter communis]CAI3956841.1 Phosphomannomutase (ManB) (PDB:6MNV) [Commensalibacter communis]
MEHQRNIDSSILREYDIRGVYDKTFFIEDAYAIGRAFGSLIVRNNGKKVVVSYDGRVSSPDLEAALVDGLKKCGLEVVRIGRGPTPMLYYAATTMEADGAVMVTASHNPKEYNGMKFMLAGKSFFGKQIQELGVQVAKGDVVPEGIGSVRKVDIVDEYVTRLLKDFGITDRKLKVVWDNSNSAAGEVLTKLVQQLPGEHIVLNGTIDGNFPAHSPDPTVPKNLVQLQDEVAKRQADIGIAFDGDADRIGVIDDKGNILWGDQLMIVYSRDILPDNQGATIIADVKASQILFEEVKKAGGNPLMWCTGHSLIKSKMAETKALLGGEMSGHIFFADKWYGFDDALYVAVRTLDIVSRLKGPLSEITESLPKAISTPEIRFDCPDDRKFDVVREVAARLQAEKADVVTIDGVRVNTADGWWLLRASNTQASLVARAESTTGDGLENLKNALKSQLSASGVELPEV